MKYFIAAFLVCVLGLTGCSSLKTNGSENNRGSWSVSGNVGMEGYLDMLTNDEPGNESSKVVWEIPSDRYDSIYGNLDILYEKPIMDGTFSAVVGVDYFSGLSAGLNWESRIMDGDFTAGINFNRDHDWAENWPAIILFSGYDTGTFGLRAAGVNGYWSEAKLTEWVLLFFRRQPNKLSWDYRNNENYPDPALQIYELNAYYRTFDGQLKIDVCYVQHPWVEYRDYFRASDIVARNWNGGNQTIGFAYTPNFMDKKLTAGFAVTEIGRHSTTISGNNLIRWYSLEPDPGALPGAQNGAFDRIVFGAKYDTDNFAISAMFNTGNTGGAHYWFLNKDARDKDMEDGYFDLFGAESNTYRPIRSEMGFNFGTMIKSDVFKFNGDVEVTGFSDIEAQGMMAAGVKGTFSPTPLLETSLTSRVFLYLGSDPQYPEGGLFGVHPFISYDLVRDTLKAAFRVDFISGIIGENISMFRFVKFNPKLFWTINGDERTTVELGYTYRYDFNKYTQHPTENSINLKMKWKFGGKNNSSRANTSFEVPAVRENNNIIENANEGDLL